MQWVKFFILLSLGPVSHFAMAAEVVFIEAYQDGKLIQLEPNGRFYHVAIRVGDKWVHAHPHRGVDVVDDLTIYGHKFYYLHNEAVPEPSKEWLAKWVGKPFDFFFRWGNPTATYCTRLIAEFFGIRPHPMQFKADHWAEKYGLARGELGLSPDDLYNELIERDFVPFSRCEEFLEAAP